MLGPVPFLRQIVEVHEQPLIVQLFRRWPDLPLHRGRWRPAGNTIQGQRLFSLRTDGGIVHPGAATLIVFLREYADRQQFTGACIEVNDIGLLCDSGRRRDRQAQTCTET